MCGLVGVISTGGAANDIDRGKFFKNALIADAIRGPHSTGFFKVDKSNFFNSTPSVEVLKRAYHANDFLDLKYVDSSLSKLQKTQILIGHNRWATMGGIDHDTAHPFQHGDVTLVHNGTLDYWNDLPGSTKFDVDSEAIAYALSQTDDPKTILEKLDGAYALIWYDMRDEKIHFARNEQRPLHLAYEKKQNTLLLASEAGMLEWLAGRNRFDIEDVWSLKPGVHVSMDPEDTREYEVEEFEIYESWYEKYGYQGPGGTGNQGGNHHTPAGGSNSQSAANSSSNQVSGQAAKEDVAKAHLKNLGLELGNMVTFEPIDFEYYKVSGTDVNSTHGKLIGFVSTPSGKEAEIHVPGLEAKTYESMQDDPIVVDVIGCSCVVYGDEPYYTVFGKNPMFMVEEEDESPAILEEDIDTSPELNRCGPMNQMVSEMRWEELIQNGCEMCGGDIDPEDDQETGWDSAGRPICKHCLSQNGWDFRGI